MNNEVLKVENLFKSFGGNAVIQGVNLSIEKGELSSIIGPNGAGKTTLFNLVTGLYLPDSGSIRFEGNEISGREPYDIVRRGIGKTFQITSIFPRLSVLDNMIASVISCRRGNLDMIRSVKTLKDVREKALEILENVGLADMAHRQSGTLAHGNQKRLDIAVALALEPKLLLLDEPTAGMSPEERLETVDLIRNLWENLKITMLFIEHDMDIVFSISQKIRVLCYGDMIAEGPPEKISKNEKVIEVYWGKSCECGART